MDSREEIPDVASWGYVWVFLFVGWLPRRELIKNGEKSAQFDQFNGRRCGGSAAGGAAAEAHLRPVSEDHRQVGAVGRAVSGDVASWEPPRAKDQREVEAVHQSIAVEVAGGR